MSAEGNKSDAYLAKEVMVSVVASPKVPVPLNCKFPLITALPDVTNETEFICPLTPKPPKINIAPVAVVVEAVVSDIIVWLENVLTPAIVCAWVVTKPVAPDPAYGMLKVCVEVEEDILKSVPEVPVANVCVDAVKPLSEVKPEAPEPTSKLVPTLEEQALKSIYAPLLGEPVSKNLILF